MKYVIQTQFLENYGAHDWDGQGTCPQRWKPKGGSTYIVDVSLAQAQDPAFYEQVEQCIAYRSEYSQEYILSHDLIDDVDFDESNHVQEWEEPIYASFVGGALECIRESKDFFSLEPVAKRTWTQIVGGHMENNSYEEYAA